LTTTSPLILSLHFLLFHSLTSEICTTNVSFVTFLSLQHLRHLLLPLSHQRHPPLPTVFESLRTFIVFWLISILSLLPLSLSKKIQKHAAYKLFSLRPSHKHTHTHHFENIIAIPMGLLFLGQFPSYSSHYQCAKCHTHIASKHNLVSKECYVRIGEHSETHRGSASDSGLGSSSSSTPSTHHGAPQMFLFFQNSLACKTQDGELIALKDAILNQWVVTRTDGRAERSRLSHHNSTRTAHHDFLITYRVKDAINVCEMDISTHKASEKVDITSCERNNNSPQKSHVLKELCCLKCNMCLGWRYVSTANNIPQMYTTKNATISHPLFVFLRRKLVLSHSEDVEREDDEKMCKEVSDHPVLREGHLRVDNDLPVLMEDSDLEDEDEGEYDEGEEEEEEEDYNEEGQEEEEDDDDHVVDFDTEASIFRRLMEREGNTTPRRTGEPLDSYLRRSYYAVRDSLSDQRVELNTSLHDFEENDDYSSAVHAAVHPSRRPRRRLA